MKRSAPNCIAEVKPRLTLALIDITRSSAHDRVVPESIMDTHLHTNDKYIEFAIVGCGALAELYYAPALKGLAGAVDLRVAVIVDPSSDRRAMLRKAFPKARAIASLADLAPGEVGAAVVASPQRFHADQTITLLSAGMHVLCEKPMASTVQEANAMVAAATENRRLLSVGLFRRFFPTSNMIRELVTGGTLGKPISFEWKEGGPFNWPAASPSFFQKSASPGGVFADIGTHVLDLLLWWFGEPESFDYEDDAIGGIEANARLRLRFGNGVTGLLRLSRDTAIPNGTRIRFERGSVWFQGASAESVVVQLDGCSHVLRSGLHKAPAFAAGVGTGFGQPARTYSQSFMEQILNLCRAIRGEESLIVPGAAAARGMDLIERCYAARRRMLMPWLTSEEQIGAARLFTGAS